MAKNTILLGSTQTPIVISDAARPLAGAYLPGTFVRLVNTSTTQATAVSGAGRLAVLLESTIVGFAAWDSTTSPCDTAYPSGDVGHASIPLTGQIYSCRMAAATYTKDQELTVAASGRLAAAATGDTVVATFDQAGGAVSAGARADVAICNFYTKA